MVLLYPLVHCVLRNDIILLKDEDEEKKLENNKNKKTHQTILLSKPMTEQMCMCIIQNMVSSFCQLPQTGLS